MSNVKLSLKTKFNIYTSKCSKYKLIAILVQQYSISFLIVALNFVQILKMYLYQYFCYWWPIITEIDNRYF